jgi:hypothetical protein
MNQRRGFGIGLIVGFVGWLMSNGYLIFEPAPLLTEILVVLLGFGMFVLSVTVGITSIWRQKAAISPAWDGFIYGFTMAFDIPYIIYILIQILQGHFPFPLQWNR